MRLFPRWSLDVQEEDRSPKEGVIQWSMAGPEIPHGHRWILTQIPIGFRTAVAGNSPRTCTDMPHCFAVTAAMFMHHVLRFSLTFILKTKDKPYTTKHLYENCRSDRTNSVNQSARDLKCIKDERIVSVRILAGLSGSDISTSNARRDLECTDSVFMIRGSIIPVLINFISFRYFQ
jgi:hypothetical protein